MSEDGGGNGLEHIKGVEAYFIGVDIGRTMDHSAVCVLARRMEVADPENPRVEVMYPMYYATYMRQLDIGTPYYVLIEELDRLWRLPALIATRNAMIIDQTGVGAPIVEAVRKDKKIAPCIGVVFTGGERATQTMDNEYHVPKAELVSTLVHTTQRGRIKLLPGLEHEQEYFDQLAVFGYKVNRETGNISYEALQQQVHDDLVVATALALWYGERKWPAIAPGRRVGWVSEEYDPLGRT
ncbi:MAG TPA: hypothetical protein VM537_15330 [Anaerolineae bacterium]|nr:hypothetical protein [Anaerolineae bacterium]